MSTATRETLSIVVAVGWAIVIPAWVFVIWQWRKLSRKARNR